jgi:hypothetical protein
MTHKQLSKEIRAGLGQANKSLNTAERFGNRTFYNQGEAKLRHAKADIQSVGQYKVSRVKAFRHAIGFSKRGGYMVTAKAGGSREVMMTGLTRHQAAIHAKNIRRTGYLSARVEKAHPPGCNCPFHGGHKRSSPATKGIGRSPGFSLRGSAVGGLPRRL